ncbi:hypothetical protein LTR84_012660 [Exophiala bonariae]|uniref:Major facilitator superfamily (MFS) profile domain-containing protein n=1 Tax=Exophiala bonariae TaxID=1690606 RepID=A0AAV9NJ15_9EURO|nr:hypothetical protein LTR84_012660 [Exophiala bonariae]
MFTATKLQVATYLFGVCPFSIAFLVFLNSSVSFVITDLIGQQDRVGDAVGTLGFADELLALVACPLWGLLADRILGLRLVCVLGYLIIGLSLVVFVQARDVYPQLLLARLLFSVGGAAASTMVTAILPAVAGNSQSTEESERGRSTEAMDNNRHSFSPSVASELTITPARYASRSPQRNIKLVAQDGDSDIARSTSRLAGHVGMLTGGGALIALMVFLPLPAKFQYAGYDQETALRYSFYIVAVIALILAVWCSFGLGGLQTELESDESKSQAHDKSLMLRTSGALKEMYSDFLTALLIGFRHSEIAIGYIGGFVARASSVGISLFVPLLVNAMFMSSDLCQAAGDLGNPSGLPDIKRRCPRAYVVAAELTGAAETVALIFAPIFGYWSAKSARKEYPLIFAAVAGITGYPLFASQFDPDDKDTGRRVVAFLAVSLIGISQIGAIVCSLGTLSKGILEGAIQNTRKSPVESTNDESQPLLNDPSSRSNDTRLSALKGSFAGVYSLYGGAAILILTKLGGLMFDKVSLSAPFYIMAAFNSILLLACVVLSLQRAKSSGEANNANGILGS